MIAFVTICLFKDIIIHGIRSRLTSELCCYSEILYKLEVLGTIYLLKDFVTTMTLGEQWVLEDEIEKAELEDLSLLMLYCHKGKNASQNSEWNETEKSESASENDANRSSERVRM